jgi:uncharacterized protein (TIGR03437 family)
LCNARFLVSLLAGLVGGLCATAVAPAFAQQQVITTIAGTNFTFPGTPLPAVNAPLGSISGVAVDANGNVYVADPSNNIVERFVPGGQLTVVAGNGIAGFSGDGGPAVNASLDVPAGVAVDSAGNLYISDTGNNRIRKVSGGTITTVAGNGIYGFSGDGGPATSASLYVPTGVAVDSAGNFYIADYYNNRVRKVSGGTIMTVAGNGAAGFSGDGGAATSASLKLSNVSGVPNGVAVDSAGNLYIADTGNYRIRKVSGGTITTVAGNGIQGFSGDGGPATSAMLGGANSGPTGVAVDSAGNLYIADQANGHIRRVSGGTITTFAGNGAGAFSGDGGPATRASLNFPYGVGVDSAGNLYIADTENYRIRMVSGGTITTVAGNGLFEYSGEGGPATSASLNLPQGSAVDSAGNIYIADEGNSRVRKVSGGIITTVAGNGNAGFSGDGGPATSASLDQPNGVAVDSAGNLYIADRNNFRIRKVSGGIITTFAGGGNATGDGGPATSASIGYPQKVALDSSGNLYISDAFSGRIRKVSGGIITTVAGNGTYGFSGDGGPATSASLNSPQGIAVDSAGSVYIADFGNNRVRKVSGGTITTVAGNGTAAFSGDGGPATSASLNFVLGVAVDSTGNLYIADDGNNRIRKVSGGTIRTVAGSGAYGFSGDGGLATSASLDGPADVAVDSAGNLYIPDASNNRIREVAALPPTFTVSPLTLSFSAVSGGQAPSAQTVQIAGSVPNLAFTAQVAGAPWLTLSADTGTLPANLQVSADPTQLNAGSYAATIVITVPVASTKPVSVQVSFAVTVAATQKLALSDQSLTFDLAQGEAPATMQLTLTNQGSGPLGFTASAAASGGNWISISPAAGTVTPASPVSLTVTASPGALATGTYTSTITVARANGSQVITVPATLTISAPPEKIELSPLGFTFIAVARGGTVLPQTLSILNRGAGSMNWTAQPVTASGSSCPWINLSASSGTVTRPLVDVSPVDVSINAQGLAMAPGSYYCLIQVSADNASNSPHSALVVLDMLPAGSNPGPNVQPTGMVFTTAAGAPDQGSKIVQVANVTAVNVTFGSAVAYNPDVGPWLKILPRNATVTPDQPTQIVIQPDMGSLPVGVYRAALTLIFNDGEIRSVGILGVVAPAGTTPITPAADDGPAPARPRAASGCTPTTLYPIFTELSSGASVPAGWPSAIVAEVVDDCGNAIDSGSVVASFNNGDPPLPLSDIQNGQWTASWTPGVVQSNGVTVTLTAKQPAANLSGTAQETIGLAGGQSQPIVASQPVSAVTLTPGPIAPGDLMVIQGSGLADAQASSSSSTLVLIGPRSAPLLYVSPTQVIALVPPDVPVNSTTQIAMSRGTSVVLLPAVNISTTHPAIWSKDGTGQGQALIYNAAPSANSSATTLADASNPAQAGGTIIIYCSGLGAVGAQGNATNVPTVSIGGAAAKVTYSGSALPANYPPSGAPMLLGLISASLGGLYQITATVPAGLASGPTQVIISSVGQTSQSGVTMMIAGSTSVVPPNITSIDTAGGFPTIAQNAFIEIKGSNLAPAAVSSPDCAPGYCWQASDFVNNQMPTALHGVSVMVDGKPAFVYFISPTQINALTPLDSTTGSVQVVVNNNGALSTPFTVTENAVAPSFLLFSSQGYIAATHLNNTGCAASGLVDCYVGPPALYPGASTPAAPGETIVAYAVGFGLPSTTLTAGSATQTGSLPSLPSCKIGGNPATVGFAGLTSPGLYQFNMTIPSTAANGDNSIICTYGGLATPPGDLITVQ